MKAEPPRLDAVGEWLAAATFRIGEICGCRDADDSFRLSHHADADRENLQRYERAEDATEIARYDDAGKYRPLKTAPNLRRGWELRLRTREETQLAVNLFYPGRLAAFRAWRDGNLRTTPLRATLARQTGMYRAAAKISDAQIGELVGTLCRSDGGCLRTICWTRDEAGTLASSKLPPSKYDPAVDQTGGSEDALPLLCQEACNLLVAAAREVVKRAPEA